MFNLLTHYKYNYDIDNQICNLELDNRFRTYFLDHLASNYSYTILEEQVFEKVSPSYQNILFTFKKNHSISNLSDIHPTKLCKLSLKINKIPNMDWWSESLPETFEEFNSSKFFEDSKKQLFKK
jgi:hypothetical protein